MQRLGMFLVVVFIAVLALNIGADEEDQTTQIRIRDRCDPATFNAALRPGACVGSGTITFASFTEELVEDHVVGAWRFHPPEFEAEEGQKLTLVSKGGETHTFTRVEDFGGGFVAPLNAQAGNLEPRPECAQVLPDGRLAPQPPSPNNIFVPAGATVQGPTISDDDEEIKFQCCIHPSLDAHDSQPQGAGARPTPRSQTPLRKADSPQRCWRRTSACGRTRRFVVPQGRATNGLAIRLFFAVPM